ncbi:LysR family transcriptional regulator [Streptomyces sp. NPDC056661]|uniref:helix-turn-helix domain-containing protein n=1 Tax=Streptomyces sp. NPDC056661 TaxID=3345898 RepID=UPI003675B3E7
MGGAFYRDKRRQYGDGLEGMADHLVVHDMLRVRITVELRLLPAAELHGVTPSPVSQQLRILEEETRTQRSAASPRFTMPGGLMPSPRIWVDPVGGELVG